MNIGMQLFIGACMIGLTVAIQAIAFDQIIKRAPKVEHLWMKHSGKLWQPLMSSCVVLCIFLVQVVNIWLWVFLYRSIGCEPLQEISDTLYFATVTYTTLGYGDIILGPSCRMLSGVEATNGFILFGWAAAFIFELISRIYKREARSL